ncbi:MerR family transcriptional regulator [Actinomadura craniellae]|uniref:hypothetical protein n=1 Tax=Actinomadura craniellae TaxID=2231787 RepID=UPI0011BDF2F3|nr:hypothetical protein [Actinomadura craniellae]
MGSAVAVGGAGAGRGGQLPFVRTLGGHRRYPRKEVELLLGPARACAPSPPPCGTESAGVGSVTLRAVPENVAVARRLTVALIEDLA